MRRVSAPSSHIQGSTVYHMPVKHSGIKQVNITNSQTRFYLVGYCIKFNNTARSSSWLLAHNIKHFSNKFLLKKKKKEKVHSQQYMNLLSVWNSILDI